MAFAQFQGKMLFVSLQHVLQIVLSGYGLRHSYVAITNLRKYEETTKKAAKWSNEVQRQLNTTRKTQGIGVVSNVLSVVLASVLLTAPFLLPGRNRPIVSSAMLATVLGARQYIKSFWAPGAKDSTGKDQGARVPLPKLGDYNLAVQKTEDLLKCLEYLEYSWFITSFLAWIMPGGEVRLW